MILLGECPQNMSYKEPVLYVIYVLLVALAGSIFTSMYMVYALSVVVIHSKIKIGCWQVDNGSDLVWDI